MARVETTTFSVFFVQITTSSVDSMIWLYVILTVNIFILVFNLKSPFCTLNVIILELLDEVFACVAYGLLVGLLFQILVNCLLGNAVEVTVCQNKNCFIKILLDHFKFDQLINSVALITLSIDYGVIIHGYFSGANSSSIILGEMDLI